MEGGELGEGGSTKGEMFLGRCKHTPNIFFAGPSHGTALDLSQSQPWPLAFLEAKPDLQDLEKILGEQKPKLGM